MKKMTTMTKTNSNPPRRCHRLSDVVQETLNAFVTGQLIEWPLCRKNYSDLMQCRRRELHLGDFPAALQFNPARIRSTGAKVDKTSIAARKCFLCADNRPREQFYDDFTDNFEILVNPYPIFPLHLTIAAKDHIPQSQWPDSMVTFVEKLPGVCAFYNGAKAGASAPDHLHFQAGADCELPIVDLVERLHPISQPGLKLSTDSGLDLPFGFWSWVIEPGIGGIESLAQAMRAKGYARRKGEKYLSADKFDPDRVTPDLTNVYCWLDPSGLLRVVVIPRSAHRPDCYYDTGDKHHTVSPGAVDMAGLVILPNAKDFNTLTADELSDIYHQVALTPAEFSSLQPLLLK